jgi:serine/threonine-protein kinase
MSASSTDLPPRYSDAEPIGGGGMGEIFRATDRELRRDVAVKVLARRFAADPELRERFRREALAAARLSSHPSIVTIFDVAEHDGRPLIVMEYLSGGSLETCLRNRAPCAPAQALDWLAETASALDAAHRAGVVHRDAKPGNLLLDANGHLHVADFGVASAAGLTSFTQTGTILGTAGYLPPEQARGERATAASDLYSLAVVAWELLTGHRPFESTSATAEATAHVTAPVPSIQAANPTLPARLDDVFARALAKDPRARFGSGAELVGTLRQALHDDAGETGWIRPRGRPAAVLPAAALPTLVQEAPPPERGPAKSRSRRSLVLTALVLVAGSGALAAVIATRGSGDRAAPPVVTRNVTRTVTAATTSAPPPGPRQTGIQLNAAGYAQMRAGNYPTALGLLERAVQELSGSGSLDEAYADYNLAYTRSALGDCTDVLALLDRAQAVEGPKSPIDRLRGSARQRCGGHDNGNGKGHGKGKEHGGGE